MIQTPNLSSVPASLNKHTAGQCAAVSFITQSNYGISFKKVSLKTGFCNCDLSLVNVCLSCLYLYILYSIQSTYWVNTLLCPCACGLFCELSFSARLYSLPVRQKACVHTHTHVYCVFVRSSVQQIQLVRLINLQLFVPVYDIFIPSQNFCVSSRKSVFTHNTSSASLYDSCLSSYTPFWVYAFTSVRIV